MKYFFSQVICITLYVVTGCKNDNNEAKITDLKRDTSFYEANKVEQIAQSKGGKLSGFSEYYFPNGNIKLKKHFVEGSAFGPAFEYYSDGGLRKFSYLVNDDKYTYSKEYNKKGELVKEDGNPLVRYNFYKNKSKDTLSFEFHFCDFGFDTLQVLVSSDSKNFKQVILSNSYLSHTKELKGWKIIKDLDRTSFYFKVKGINKSIIKYYNDTLTVYK